jgi:hypothetical protein
MVLEAQILAAPGDRLSGPVNATTRWPSFPYG